MKNKKEPEQNIDSKANEPIASYGNKSIFFVNSFEEMEQAEARQMAELSPIDHLKNATELIKRVYANELNNMIPDNKIHFK